MQGVEQRRLTRERFGSTQGSRQFNSRPKRCGSVVVVVFQDSKVPRFHVSGVVSQAESVLTTRVTRADYHVTGRYKTFTYRPPTSHARHMAATLLHMPK
jgi:hypothetical protein